jgi:hypothetical protein
LVLYAQLITKITAGVCQLVKSLAMNKDLELNPTTIEDEGGNYLPPLE